MVVYERDEELYLISRTEMFAILGALAHSDRFRSGFDKNPTRALRTIGIEAEHLELPRTMDLPSKAEARRRIDQLVRSRKTDPSRMFILSWFCIE